MTENTAALSDEDYSKSVRKRIGREVAKRKSAEDSFKTAKEEAAEMRVRAEAAEERAEKLEGEKLVRTKGEKKDLLKQAIEDGDTDAQAKILDEISEANVHMTEHARRQEAKTKGKTEEKPKEEEEPAPIHKSAEAFIERNQWFESDPKARARVIELEKQLREDEDFELGDELYQEIEAKIFEEMPELNPEEEEVIDPIPDMDPEPITPVSRGAGRRPKRKESGSHMSTTAKATMRRYGLDPDNANHIKGFLKHHKGV